MQKQTGGYFFLPLLPFFLPPPVPVPFLVRPPVWSAVAATSTGAGVPALVVAAEGAVEGAVEGAAESCPSICFAHKSEITRRVTSQ